MGEEFDISKLLRQKQFEQPPQEYFDKFLRDFRRRQRAELIHRSTWEVLWDRIAAIAPSFRVPQVAYATIAVMAASASTFILTRPSTAPMTVAAMTESASPTLSLTSSKPVTIGETLAASARPAGSMPSHYVLQSRPVSNEKPLSF
jgi:anti-sigma-K factor RskA